jgi:hypothetical protein
MDTRQDLKPVCPVTLSLKHRCTLLSVPELLTAGHLAAMHTAVDQLASVLKDSLYLGLQQEQPTQSGAAQTISRSDRHAWRTLVATTLTAIQENVMS